MKLSDEDKRALTAVLKDTDKLPPVQGKVILHISPERKVSAVEYSFTIK